MESPLDNIRIAKPCPVAWSDMQGDDRVRFCSKCQLSVYNFENLTTREAENLLSGSTGRLCGRIYQRADGRVMTKDCKDGVIRGLAKVSLSAAIAGFALFASAIYAVRPDEEKVTPEQIKEKLRCVPVVGAVVQMIDPPARHFTGVVALPSPSTPSSGSSNP